MAEASGLQSSFLGGEWSAAMQGRMDDQRYRTALNACLNAFPIESGAWVRRPGTIFAGQTMNNKPGRVYPFNFADRGNYTMEFTDNNLRFRIGDILVRTNDDTGVAAISSARPAVVTLTTAVTWTGTVPVVLYSANVPPVLQNRQFLATVIDSLHLSLADMNGNPIDGAAIGPLTVQGVPIGRVLALSTPFASGSGSGWNSLRVVQAETITPQGALTPIAVFLNGSTPQQMTVTKLPVGASNGQFAQFSSLAAISFQDGPYLDLVNDGTTLTPSALSGAITLTLAGGATRFTTGSDVGRLVRYLSIPALWNPSTVYSNGSTVYYAGNVYTYQNAGGGTIGAGLNPVANPIVYLPTASPAGYYGWQLITNAARWTWGIITAVASATSATLSIQAGNPGYTNATPYWQLGAYSATTGFPTCGTFHEGRLWLSGAIPNRVDASVVSNPVPDSVNGAQVNGSAPSIFCFSPTDLYGNIFDNFAISASLLSPDADHIFWLEPDQQGIIAGTKNGEWLIQATGANLPLTPTSIQAHRYTRIGCANVEPRRCNLVLAFVQFFKRKVMEYFSDVFSGRLTGPNLAETAKHLTVNFIQELAYQRESTPIIWMRDAAGVLLGCSYKRESLFSRERPTFAGWHRHQIGPGVGAGGLAGGVGGSSSGVQSIAMGSNASGTLDALAMLISGAVVGENWVEVISDLPDENTITQLRFLDHSVVPPTGTNLNNPGATYTTGVSGVTINGLWHLRGLTASVWIGGLDVGDYPVSPNGSITVPFGDGVSAGPSGSGYSSTTGGANPGGGAYLLTSAFVGTFGSSLPIVVGITYTSQGQVVRPASPAESGARAGPALGKIRRMHQYGVQLVNSQGLSFGSDFSLPKQMFPAYLKDAGENILPVSSLFSGVHWDTLPDDYSRDGMLAWQVTRPYPATLAAVEWFIETQDQ